MERMKKRNYLRRLIYLPVLSIALLVGCAPQVSTRHVESGLSTPGVNSLISDMEKDTQAKSEMWYWLNLGRLYQATGQYDKSIAAYNHAESILTEYENRAIVSIRNVTASAGSLLFAKGAEGYYGKGYERTLLHTMNSINYVMLGKFEDAHVEMRKMEKRQELWLKESEEKIKEAGEASKKMKEDNQNAEVNTKSLPDGYSMRSMLEDPAVAAMVNNYQDPFSYSLSAFVSRMAADPEYAQISEERAKLLNKSAGNLFNVKTHAAESGSKKQKAKVKKSSDKAKAKKTDDSGNAPAGNSAVANKPLENIMVTVVVFTGEAPSLSVEKLRLPVPPIGYTSVDLPAYSRPKNDASRVSVQYNGNEMSVLKLLYSDRMAYKTLKDEFPTEFSAAIVRAVGKGAIAYGAERAGGPVAGLLASFASDAASSGMDSKYRNWEMLPNSAYLARFAANKDGQVMINIDGFSEMLKISDKAKEGDFVLVSFLSPANVRIDHVGY